MTPLTENCPHSRLVSGLKLTAHWPIHFRIRILDNVYFEDILSKDLRKAKKVLRKFLNTHLLKRCLMEQGTFWDFRTTTREMRRHSVEWAFEKIRGGQECSDGCYFKDAKCQWWWDILSYLKKARFSFPSLSFFSNGWEKMRFSYFLAPNILSFNAHHSFNWYMFS